MRSQHQRKPIDELPPAIDALSAEVRVLREVLDEIRDALQWRNKNAAEFATVELTVARLPASPTEPAAAEHESGAQAYAAQSAQQTRVGYIPEGHPLEIRHEGSGSFYYLAGRRLQGWDLLEIWLPETGWTRGRCEWNFRKWRHPSMHFDHQQESVAVTEEHFLRWPEPLTERP